MAAPNFATIKIDSTKCTTPFDCKLCLQGCPQSVFQVARREGGKRQGDQPQRTGELSGVRPLSGTNVRAVIFASNFVP